MGYPVTCGTQAAAIILIWQDMGENSTPQNANADAGPAGDFRYTNHLIHEKSPYLLLHAHNPVDWYPWGEEAFAKARLEHKPIFLSIGYYTCHWCHVMERESFSDPVIAEILNRYFVSIKVDREERPDVDRIYMDFVQAMTGSGGWPLDVFLTPDLQPFFGGTYWPPQDAYGRPGFQTIVQRVAEAWENDRLGLIDHANRVTASLRAMIEAPSAAAGELTPATLDRVYQQIRLSYDHSNAGFGSAPKFPRPVVLNFLLRYYARTGTKDALEMTLTTLQAMARGGIRDHLGGGFHRYSTDARWHVPHFEKMLYDQAQLAFSYAEAYQITHEPFYAGMSRDILDFTIREMRSPEGGFYSAEDADSLVEAGKPEHGEGAFYVWSAEEIEKVLGPESARAFKVAYGVEPRGNVSPEQDFHGEFTGKNILYERFTAHETAHRLGMPEDEVRRLLEEAPRKLFQAREARPHPPIDDKIVTSWNGLAISTLARASQALDEPKYLATAETAARFLEANLRDRNSGALRRRYRAGEAAIEAFLDDYAFLIQGLLDLYEAGFNPHWLEWAERLQAKQDELFWEAKSGGYWAASHADSSLLFRTREDYDGAEPSPNSVAAMNLLRLAQFTNQQDWRDKAQATFRVFAGRLAQIPEAMPQMAAALDFSFAKPVQIVIAGAPDAADTRALLRLVHERFLPCKVLILADGGEGQKGLARRLPFLEGMTRENGRATAFICENYACKLPTSDPTTVGRMLDEVSPAR